MSSKGLGRGLDALLRRTDMGAARQEKNDTPEKETGTEHAPLLLPLSHLHANPSQPRQTFDAESLAELAASIREQGIIQPLLVRPLAGRPGHYQIVAGERRWRAARQAGLGQVPVHVREMSDAEVMAAALIENLQREDLNPLEEARALQQLRETLKLTQEALAARLGKSRPAIANALRLLQLSPAAQDDLHHGRLSAGHARCLLALGNDDHALAAAEVLRSHIISESLSVRQAEEAVALWREEQRLPWTAASGRPAPCTRKKLPQIAALQKHLCAALPCKARVSGDMESGRITLRYTSPQELEALLDRLHCRIPEDGPAGEAIAAPVDAKTPRQ